MSSQSHVFFSLLAAVIAVGAVSIVFIDGNGGLWKADFFQQVAVQQAATGACKYESYPECGGGICDKPEETCKGKNGSCQCVPRPCLDIPEGTEQQPPTCPSTSTCPPDALGRPRTCALKSLG